MGVYDISSLFGNFKPISGVKVSIDFVGAGLIASLIHALGRMNSPLRIV